MARLNVWVPDELADDARSAGLNISALTQAALAAELAAHATDAWLDSVPETEGGDRPSDEAVVAALDEAREEFGAPHA